ncbi:DeoR/GlpR transcriptional regulator [Paenibacillus thalictri]|uniref:DeoR/GlpR transcriptional regulator n=1 Tax=Paenibacillus thalictri TaxID=2527873 RepID=A0A4Q9DM40_9BACL|nr:DeoR/GlpR transcriptional regulator [Paenibacillus thalictri]
MSKLFASERRTKISEYLNEHKRATVQELCRLLKVTPATLRSDLDFLESEGLLERTHGGAMMKASGRSEYSFSNRQLNNLDKKLSIAIAAANLVTPGQCIILDASSTALELAKVLAQKEMRLTVITNGINSAMELSNNQLITVILIGGVVRSGSPVLEGKLGSSILCQFDIDTMFASATGFSFEDGLSDFNVYEVELKKLMAKFSRNVVALIDSSKIGGSSIAAYASTKQIDTLITDRIADPALLEKLHKEKINVVVTS